MKLAAALTTVLAVGFVGPLAAQTNTYKDSPPPLVQPIPVILGEVTNVTSHSVAVRTTRGEAMSFETDSRTVMPLNLMMAKRVKVEFHLMENGTHHAKRVTVIEPGSFDWERYDEELAMVPYSTERTDLASAETERTESTMGNGTDGTDGTNGSDGDVSRAREDADANRNELRSDAAGTNGDDELPRTASRQPLLLGLGLAALATAAVIGFARRRRSA
jgi:LPXTG-motif cell wall-anchored protein